MKKIKIEIFTSFYHSDGMEHPNMLTTTWLSSMFLRSNIPKMMKFGRVVHNVYCSPLDTPYLKDNYLPAANKKGLKVVFNDSLITEVSKQGQRNQLYLAMQDQMRESIKNKSIIVMASADSIFGNGLAKLAKKLKHGELLVCPTIRVSYETGFEKVKDFLRRPKDNREFAKLFIEAIPHRMIVLAKEDKYDYLTLSKVDDGWLMYHKEPAPLMYYPIDGTSNVLSGGKTSYEEMLEIYKSPYFGKYEVVDHDLPAMFFKKNKLRWVSNNDEFIWGEFTSDSVYQEMIINDFWSDAAKFFHEFPVKLFIRKTNEKQKRQII